MTKGQMNKALRGLAKTFAFQALKQLVEDKKAEIASELLSADLSSPASVKIQGRVLGMAALIAELENIPDPVDDDES